MPYNPYSPYPQNPYGQPMYGFSGGVPTPQPAATPQTNVYAFVNGIEGAKSYPMQPNQMVMLMDSENPIAYMKSANAMGQATLKYYKLVETSEDEIRSAKDRPASTIYATKAELEALVKRIDDLAKQPNQRKAQAPKIVDVNPEE